MKIRNGWVSNSSTSCFILQTNLSKDEIIEEIKLLYKKYKAYISTHDEDLVSYRDTAEACDCSLDETADTSVLVNDISIIDSIDSFLDCSYCCECKIIQDVKKSLGNGTVILKCGDDITYGLFADMINRKFAGYTYCDHC